MSADNGIYILKTKDQYRVIHTHAIDNLTWTFIEREYNSKPVPTRIIEYFGKSKYTKNRDEARDIAFNMEENNCTEYGIKIISVSKTWNQIVQEAKELAPREIEAILENYEDGRFDYDVRRLQEIIEM